MPSLAQATLWSLLVLPLVASPLLGLLTPYVALIVLLGLFAVTLARGQGGAAYDSYPAQIFLGVFIVQFALFAATADSFPDLLRAFNFTMLPMYGPLALVLAARTQPNAVERVAQLATAGVILGLGLVFIDWLQSPRPRAPNLGPIVLSNAVLALGFLASGMAIVKRDRWLLLYLLVPLLAMLTAALSGSRGPMIGIPFTALAAAVFVWRYRFNGSRRSGLIIAAGVVAVLCAGALLLQGRSATLFAIAGTVLQGGDIADPEVHIRLVLYRAGWQSFLASPWLGHGWGNIMESIKPFLAPRDLPRANLPQLHNDVLNFAVAGGVFGIAAYLAILTAPLIGALRSGFDRLRPFRLYAATTITLVYAFGGLTDLMFGFEFHTFLFVVLAAIIIGYCREPEAAA